MSNNCPVCFSTDYKVLGVPKTNRISESFISNKYNVVQCTNCKLYYVSPLIDFTGEQWSELYNSEYFADQTTWIINKRRKELSQRFDLVEKLLAGKNRVINFLDVGTGEGKALLDGFRRNWNVLGIDIVDNRLQAAKIPGIQFIQSNLLKANLPENNFDFIYVDSVLEHVLNPYEYLITIKKILKKNGIVYIGVPNEDCLFNDVRKLAFKILGKKSISEKIKPFSTPYHVVGFNNDSLNFLIKKVELTPKVLNNSGRKFDFLGYKPHTKEFWINLILLFPIEFLGKMINRDVYFEAYLMKTN